MTLKGLQLVADDAAMDKDFEWALELEGDEATRAAGAGAREKAAEHAAERSGFQRFIDGFSTAARMNVPGDEARRVRKRSRGA